MIQEESFEIKTGFDKIRELLKEKCSSSLGRDKVDEISFSTQYETILNWVNQTAEFTTILEEEDFPSDPFYDVREGLIRIQTEGFYLSEQDLFDLRRSIETIGSIVKFFDSKSEEHYFYLKALAKDVFTFPDLIRTIDRVLDKFGRIKDNASPELANIRRSIAIEQSAISRAISHALHQAKKDGFIDEDTKPTLREGRLVIPVPPAYKRKVRGIVHDESATGKTVFIEPEAAVEINNKIRELLSDEKKEVIKILTAISSELRPRVPEMMDSYNFLSEIDFIRAKALFAQDTDAVLPKVSNETLLDWSMAKHPILLLNNRRLEKEVVPLNIQLNNENRILIISGPNAGGKSVCLKTVGLLQYMLQCGLLVPMHASSRMGIFGKVLIDIGDEQSLENDLSTYSSHLSNMKLFVKQCDGKSLLLIDEFGSGTEPRIGGAIAEALLDHFNQKSAFGVITTHYTNLKNFAEETDGIINGAMLYDRHRMQPLFQLEIGNPGSSFAVEIARKIGLPESVIEMATQKVGEDFVNMDKYLQDVVRDKRYWEGKRQSIKQKEKRLEELTAKYEAELEEMGKQKKAIIREAKQESQHLLSQANAAIENTIRKIKEAQADKEKTKEARKQLEDFKEEQRRKEHGEAIERKIQPHKPIQKQPSKEEKRESIQVGDTVRIKGQGGHATVIEIKGNNATIAIGQLKSTVKTDRLEKVSKTMIKKEVAKSTFVSEATTDDLRQRQLNFKREIDVRGMRGDEALQAVTYFIDDAVMVNVDQVRILHGTGTGALRQLIRQYLQTVSSVRTFHDEHIQFGGAGITVVEF
ncbi:MAG: endonuclease MutS2 [Paludibacteraceae bacterium]|nr:endonuclease MutS2 [Paludibacteraceae bacterium]